ncbi:hypothetical protein HALLA_16655 [Halostagnicola larsenii XH-48]|uniref:Uncharacterized protein n=1 Tax=Halostagnicola larsenii XH-48 TaxID=797299 RepID=W0JVL1_9EURY|nr:hypothetical protein HALLA_16655 [Halostagnicola larsenii XH-48]
MLVRTGGSRIKRPFSGSGARGDGSVYAELFLSYTKRFLLYAGVHGTR